MTAAAFGQSISTNVSVAAPARPTIVAPDAISAVSGDPVQFTITASDPNGLTVTLTSGTLPIGASFNGNTGAFFWTTTQAQPGTYAATFTATNSAGISSTKTVTMTVAPLRAGVAGVLNAASLLPDGGCSPGALSSIFGIGFTTQEPRRAGEFPLPVQLGGVRVLGNGTPLPLLYISGTLINFQCPMSAPGTDLKIVVEAEDGSTLPGMQGQMKEATPGIYTLNASGQGQGAITISTTNELAMPKTDGLPSRPVHQGEYITIYSNGIGPMGDNAPEAGMPAPLNVLVLAKDTVRVVIGEVELEPSFAGLAPGSIGLFQINVQIPADTHTDTAVPVYLKVTLADGSIVTSNFVTISIDAPPPAQ